jgi:hypothetical protein
MKKVNRIGEKWVTNEGYTVEIVGCFGWNNYTIKFNNGIIIKGKRYEHIINGRIKNPYHKSVYGVGCSGIGKYSRINHPKIYFTWKDMLRRCYDEKEQKRSPNYIGCSVAEKWLNFQVFAEWFEEYYKENFDLDKDILIKGNKVYSPETCTFVPQEVNLLLIKSSTKRGEYPIGVCKEGLRFRAELSINGKKFYLGLFDTPEEAFQAYKVAKEKQIKIIAEKYKDQVTPQTYQALVNYKVEITD